MRQPDDCRLEFHSLYFPLPSLSFFYYSLFSRMISRNKIYKIKFLFSLVFSIILSFSCYLFSIFLQRILMSRCNIINFLPPSFLTGRVLLEDETRDRRDCRDLLIPGCLRDQYRASEGGHCTFSGTHATLAVQQLLPRAPIDLPKVSSRSSSPSPPLSSASGPHRTLLPLPLDRPTQPLVSSLSSS